jgi:Domain of unknown function (DUF5054)
MNRRQFVSTLAVGGSLLQNRPAQAGSAAPDSAPDPDVKRLLVVFKCHLDVGFVDTQEAIIQKYFREFFPRAIRLGSTLRQSGPDHYTWTTGSWLLFEYLEQANEDERKQMERAIEAGDIAWHALPFSWQSELLDSSAIAGAIGFSRSLDRRFGRNTTGAKMTDVPGHSRGLIAPLVQNGVTLLDVGVNSASTPPDVPPLFVWKDSTGHSLVMMYHRREYGGVLRVPGSDLAFAVEVRDDNSGPHTPEEIHQIYSALGRQFPNAVIKASNLTEIANAIAPHTKDLPVITSEIGDTWIYGVASDPIKLARYRELLRLRRQWIKASEFHIADPTDLAFLRRFSLAAEHTWGTDTKTWLDFDHYTPAALASMLDEPKYKVVTGSWVEKRADLDQAVATLPPKLRAQAQHRLMDLRPQRPELATLEKQDPGAPLEGAHFTVALDPSTGTLMRLRSKATGREWASREHPLAAFSYQTLSKQDYDRFLASYITVQTDWAPKDFGKPNIEKFGAESRIWTTKLTTCLTRETDREHRLLAGLEVAGPTHSADALTACPRQMFLELLLPKAEPVLHLNFSWFEKAANRLPEALWLSFHPDAPRATGWMLSKLDQPVSPFDVVSGGNRHMHALSRGLTYQDDSGVLSIEALDAALVALGEKSPIYFSNSQPEIENGIHFSLFNNGWGTNYVQWFGEDVKFRFVIRA